MLHGQLSAGQLRALDPEAFSVPACRRLVEIGVKHLGADGRVQLRPLLDEAVADSTCGPLSTELSLSEPCLDDLETHVRGCLDRLERKGREQRLAELIVRLRVAEREGREDEAQRLNAEVNALRLKKAGSALTSMVGETQSGNRHP